MGSMGGMGPMGGSHDDFGGGGFSSMFGGGMPPGMGGFGGGGPMGGRLHSPFADLQTSCYASHICFLLALCSASVFALSVTPVSSSHLAAANSLEFASIVKI